MGWEAVWPFAAGGVVLGLAAMVFYQVRKRGESEGAREVETAQGERNEEAAQIQAEPIGDAGTWLARMRKLARRDS